jgi:UPF0716 protein FxsA
MHWCRSCLIVEVLVKGILLGAILFGLAELVLLVKAGQLFGTLFPILAVILSMMAGWLLIRHYGVKTFASITEAVRTGIPPTHRPSAAIAGIFAGILLILPGFLSDLVAVVLLVPAARRIVAAKLGWRIATAGDTGYRTPNTGRSDTVIEGEAVEVRVKTRAGRRIETSSPWRR